MAGKVRAVGHKCSLKPGDYVCCHYPHQFETAVVVAETDCNLLSAQDYSGDLLGHTPLLVASIRIAALLQLQQGSRILIDCQKVQFTYVLAQVVLLMASEIYITIGSSANSEVLRQLGDTHEVVDRQDALRQPMLDDFFDAVLTDASDGFHLLGSKTKPGGRIVAFDTASPTGILNATSYLLRRGITVALFDPTGGVPIGLFQHQVTSTDIMRRVSSEKIERRCALNEALSLLRRGIIKAMPCERIDLARLPEAINVAQEDLVRSVVLERHPDSQVPVRVSREPLTFKPDASYILVGCLGGLGRSLT